VKIYGEKGLKALEDWLSVKGVENINAVNEAIKGATSWKAKAGVA
jgi:tagatose 1,6-diphosphate aldolase